MLRRHLFGIAIAMMFVAGVGVARPLRADEPASPPAQARGQAVAQERGVLSLLRLEAVAKDLNLTDEQSASLKKIADDAQKQMTERLASQKGPTTVDQAVARLQEALDVIKKAKAVLDDKQRARLQEIFLQLRGPSALRDKEIADALKLTADQTKKLNDLADERRTAIHAAIKDAGGPVKAGQDNQAGEKIAKIAKDSAEKMEEVLTPEQSEAFEKMKGKKLDLGTTPFGSLGGAGRRPIASDAKPESKPDSK